MPARDIHDISAQAQLEWFDVGHFAKCHISSDILLRLMRLAAGAQASHSLEKLLKGTALSRILSYPRLTELVGAQLALRVRKQRLDVDWVVGSPFLPEISWAVAKWLPAKRVQTTKGRQSKIQWPNTDIIPPADRVLILETQLIGMLGFRTLDCVTKTHIKAPPTCIGVATLSDLREDKFSPPEGLPFVKLFESSG